MKELETIEGIGPKTKELLNKIKIYTIEDLLNYYPYRYDIIKRSDLSNLSDGDKIIIDGKKSFSPPFFISIPNTATIQRGIISDINSKP